MKQSLDLSEASKQMVLTIRHEFGTNTADAISSSNPPLQSLFLATHHEICWTKFGNDLSRSILKVVGRQRTCPAAGAASIKLNSN